MTTISELPAAAAVEWYAQQPGRVAVIDAHGAYGYRWLADAADSVSQKVISQSDEHFGITRRPTAAFVATVLGCMKAGVTHSVIEPDGVVAAQFLGVSTVLDLTDFPASEPVSDESMAGLAPAGNLDWAVSRFGLNSSDRFAVLSGQPGQLMSGLSSALCAGATLLAEAPDLTEPKALGKWLQGNGVTVVFTTTPALRAIATHSAEGQLPALRYVFGDNSGQLLAHDVEALRRVSPSCHFVGTYRMSRNGLPLAVHAVPDGWRAEDAPLRIPLGPADTVHLLGSADRVAAIGEVGEVCLGSYRTGDLARRWPDGTLEFVGLVGADRNADPLETVAALRDLPGVLDAVVTEYVGPQGDPVLVGYVVGPDPKADTTAGRRALALRLPGHLVPEHLAVVEELTLTPAGDYDLDALPGIAMDSKRADDYVAPRTPLEHELTSVLQELLNAERVGVLDSFFELGGFSLLATQLATRIRESFGVELSLRDVFEAPTVEGLAQLIVRRQVELASANDLEALLAEIEKS